MNPYRAEWREPEGRFKGATGSRGWFGFVEDVRFSHGGHEGHHQTSTAVSGDRLQIERVTLLDPQRGRLTIRPNRVRRVRRVPGYPPSGLVLGQIN
ncbi:hypothetical protein GCM10020001_115250 [Nonomuraea salmonea]